jgi:hypothetical protein
MTRIFGPRLIVNLIVILAAVGITTRQISLVFPAIALLTVGGLVAWHRSVLGAVVTCWIMILWSARTHSLPSVAPGDVALVGVLGMAAVLGSIWAHRLSPASPTISLGVRRPNIAVEPAARVLDRAG